MLRATDEVAQTSRLPLALRIGIACGPVMAGVIGAKRLTYDVWGDTVNLAARLENQSAPGRVLVSRETRARLAGHFRAGGRGRSTSVGSARRDVVPGFSAARSRPTGASQEPVGHRRRRRRIGPSAKPARRAAASGTSPVRPAASADEELLQGRQPLDQAQAGVRAAAQQRPIVGEQAVQAVEGGGRQRGVGAAPALVALQHDAGADIEAEPRGVGDALRSAPPRRADRGSGPGRRSDARSARHRRPAPGGRPPSRAPGATPAARRRAAPPARGCRGDSRSASPPRQESRHRRAARSRGLAPLPPSR